MLTARIAAPITASCFSIGRLSSRRSRPPCCRITNLETNRGIKFSQFNQVGVQKVTVLNRRFGSERFFHQLRDGPNWFDLELIAGFWFDWPALENSRVEGHLCRASLPVTCEYDRTILVLKCETKDISRDFRERFESLTFEQGEQPAIFFKHDRNVVV